MKSVNQSVGPCVLVQFSMEADSITRACPQNGLFYPLFYLTARSAQRNTRKIVTSAAFAVLKPRFLSHQSRLV